MNNLRFADDVALIGENPQEIEECLNDLETESQKLGLKINIEKTKIQRNKLIAPYIVKVGSHVTEEVDINIYLGQRISLADKDKSGEITRRIQAGWNAYNNYKELFKSNIPNSLKRKLHDKCVLPVMIYRCETWNITKVMERRIAATQRKMERSMLGLNWEDRKTNEWTRVKQKSETI